MLFSQALPINHLFAGNAELQSQMSPHCFFRAQMSQETLVVPPFLPPSRTIAIVVGIWKWEGARQKEAGDYKERSCFIRSMQCSMLFDVQTRFLPVSSKIHGRICREILARYWGEILVQYCWEIWLQNLRELWRQYLCGIDWEFCGWKTCSRRWENSPQSLGVIKDIQGLWVT